MLGTSRGTGEESDEEAGPSGGGERDELDGEIARSVREKRALKLKLLDPIDFAGEKIEHLELRQMRAREWYEFPSDPAHQSVGDFLRVAQRLCAQPEKVMHQLSTPDTLRVVQVVAGFMQRGR